MDTIVSPAARRTLDSKPIAPSLFAHFVLRSSNMATLVDWYCTVLNMHVVQRNDFICFSADILLKLFEDAINSLETLEIFAIGGVDFISASKFHRNNLTILNFDDQRHILAEYAEA